MNIINIHVININKQGVQRKNENENDFKRCGIFQFCPNHLC